jgi:hypothetical protein
MFSVALCVLCALRVKKRGTRHPERGGRPDVSTGDIPEHRAGFRRWIICSSVQPQRAQRTTEGHREHLAGRLRSARQSPNQPCEVTGFLPRGGMHPAPPLVVRPQLYVHRSVQQHNYEKTHHISPCGRLRDRHHLSCRNVFDRGDHHTAKRQG